MTKEGKNFTVYLSKLTNSISGEEVPVTVKFRGKQGGPDSEECPLYINFNREDANLAKKHYRVEDGTVMTKQILWITEWSKADEVWRDTSLDGFIGDDESTLPF